MASSTKTGTEQIPPDETYTSTKGMESERSRWTGTFVCCPWEKFKRPGAIDLLTWKFSTPNNSKIPVKNDTQGIEKLKETLPIHDVNLERLQNPPSNKVQVTWIGHATVLVQFDEINILTDPVFEHSCGPTIADWFDVSYKRYRRAACEISDLPKLDAVIISHNHYDHLEKSAVQKIAKDTNVRWFVTMEQKHFLIKNYVEESQITVLDWWKESKETIHGKQFRFVCVPSQHWCQREPFDMNKVLWCSWVIQGPTKSFYFAGDTGYNDRLFKTIGKKYGPFDLAAIPIGAYEPRDITKFQHVDPEEAVEIHKDVCSKQSIGIHWGTFELTNEFYAEPPQKVEKEMLKTGLNPNDFWSLCHGETWIVGDQNRKRPPFMDVKPPAQENRSERRQDKTHSSWW